MNTSTIDFRGRSAKRLGVVLLGFAVALAGTFAFSNGQAAAADPFKMEFKHSRLNLGFLFTGGEYKYLPAPGTLPGQVSNPNFNPANPPTGDNTPTVFSQTATPLPDYNAINAADITRPGAPPAGTNADPRSFKPLGCGTPVTVGIYFAVVAGETPGPDSLVYNPDPDNPFGVLLGQPIPNSGAPGAAEYYRVLPKGAILPEGAPSATFANPFAAVPGQPATRTLTAPYPAADTLWRPYAMGLNTATTPPTPFPQGLSGTTAFSGTPGLRFTPNGTGGADFCPNPANAEVSGTVDGEGNVSILPAGFDFPISQLDASSVVAGTYAPVTLKAEEDLKGKFDSATGQLNLTGQISARVLLGLQYDPLGSYCKVNLKGISLTSSASEPKSAGFLGLPFSTGSTNVEKLQGPGALTGTWNVTAADVEPVGVAGAGTTDPVNCTQTATLGAGNGGIWLSTDQADPPAYPNPKLALAKMTGKKSVKGGKKVKVTVRVRNTGIVSGTAKVTLKSSNKKRATVQKSVSVTVPKGATRSKTFMVKTKKQKGKVTISGKLGKKTLKLPIRVK